MGNTTFDNEYADGINDENEWEEDILNSDVPLDNAADDYLADPDAESSLYNESGYERERLVDTH